MKTEMQAIEILLVEDNPGDIRLTQEALKDSKLHNNLSVVKDGVEALAFLRCEGQYTQAPRPDIILLDLNLPRKDGREVLVELKTDPVLEKIPVVILTTSNTQEDIHYTQALGATAYQTKPVTFKGMVEFMKSLTTYSPHGLNSAAT